jgi:hypothetical protein
VTNSIVLNRRAALLGGFAAAAPALAEPSAKLPSIQLGGYTVSRLVVGGNPISGNSHLDGRTSRDMTDYFSAAT